MNKQFSALCCYLDLCDKSNPERIHPYYDHLKVLKCDEKDFFNIRVRYMLGLFNGSKWLEIYLIEDMKTARELHKDLNTVIISPEQIEEHKSVDDWWVCKRSFNLWNFNVKQHNHYTGKYHSSICCECSIQIKDSCKIPVFFHNLN